MLVVFVAAGCHSSAGTVRVLPAVARAASPPRDPAVVRVATLNAHRYFDTVCDSGRCARRDYEALPDPAAFAAQTDALAVAVTRLDADVVCMQEVESERSLAALRDRLGGAFPTAVLGDLDQPGSVNVAVLSRDPLLEAHGHRERALVRPDGSRTTFSRELLEVHLSHAGRRVIVFSAHFRSKVRDDAGRRLAEAVAAREIVDAAAAQHPDALVVLGGDLNDTPGSPTLDALERGASLSRAAADLAPDAQATYAAWQGPVALDHLYVAARARGRYVPGSARVLRDADGAGFGGSDHASLRADFTWP